MAAVQRTCDRTRSLGATFPLFSELKDAIELYQQTKHVQLYIAYLILRLQGAAKRMPKIAKEAPSELAYYSLTYACHRTKIQGSRLRHTSKSPDRLG